MSLGVNLLMYLTEIVSKSKWWILEQNIWSTKYKHKKDYPSGTALMLGKGTDGKMKIYIFNW